MSGDAKFNIVEVGGQLGGKMKAKMKMFMSCVVHPHTFSLNLESWTSLDQPALCPYQCPTLAHHDILRNLILHVNENWDWEVWEVWERLLSKKGGGSFRKVYPPIIPSFPVIIFPVYN